MTSTRARRAWAILPVGARVAAGIALAWALLLCVSPPPASFWSWQLQGSGIVTALSCALLLGSRMELRGAWMMPIFVAASFAQSLWAAFAGLGVAIVIDSCGWATGPAAMASAIRMSLVIGTGLVYLALIGFVNRHAWSLAPLVIGILLAAAFASFGVGSILHSRWYGACASCLLLGITASLAWGVIEVRGRAARIEAGHCASCGYDSRDVDHGPCPECGKYRDEIKDGLL